MDWTGTLSGGTGWKRRSADRSESHVTTVLVVEDEPLIALDISDELTDAGDLHAIQYPFAFSSRINSRFPGSAPATTSKVSPLGSSIAETSKKIEHDLISSVESSIASVNMAAGTG